ncbi:ATP F0F1 synthase subunit B [Mangrovimicrobium sediminis]|uniref:ATP synthase subunit b n=1 Tax=Mangrovimicrobium sediminis TaxID=2562682 RepID=A0A4Z0LYX4_9GAMM|nr:ATP F0F1 synthase subunit B [Haliea sp. SAOS-164]TGD72583.1 ATP F0F1 synthase subunit B [Haliea sp. SAOS-164]
MELTWSTFILEIINFLVLVWLLKRFLYRPVLEVIARRRAAIAEDLAQARQTRDAAQASQAQYEGRLADWERERGQALEALHHEVEAERARRLEEVATEVAAEREKNRVLQGHRDAQTAARLQAEALDNAAGFAARLLGAGASAELEGRLIDLALGQLASVDTDTLDNLRRELEREPGPITVGSAFALDAARRQALEARLDTLFPGRERSFEQQPELLAGLCITAGGWRLGLNLRDELQGFARVGR